MCGIFGYAGPPSDWRQAVLLESLCIEDQVRGVHSTGLVALNPERSTCLILKETLKGDAFVAKGFTTFLYQNELSLVLGHNRQASSGKKNARNAHPFGVRSDTGWCFGIHNGTMHLDLDEFCEAFGIKKPDVDSEAIIRAIAYMKMTCGSNSEAIQRVTEWISAKTSFACAYMDPMEKNIYLWRNTERPLHIFDAREHGLGRWFCSTPEIFSAAWERHRGALGDKSKVKMFSLVPGRLYCLHEGGEVETLLDMQLAPYEQQSPAIERVGLPNQSVLNRYDIKTGSQYEIEQERNRSLYYYEDSDAEEDLYDFDANHPSLF